MMEKYGTSQLKSIMGLEAQCQEVPGNGPQKNAPQVMVGVKRNIELSERQTSLVARLYERLEPVLRPSSPPSPQTAGNGTSSNGPVAGLAMAWHQASDALSINNELLQDILDRLEL